MAKRVQVLNAKAIEQKILRMALEIIETNIDEKEIVIAGIQGRGADIAKALAYQIKLNSKIAAHEVAISINKKQPTDCSLDTQLNLNGKSIVVVDDVANSGRTLLYALNPFLNILAKQIQIAVLVDRRHKSYPVSPDIIGLSISTTLQEHIKVEVKNGVVTGAYLE